MNHGNRIYEYYQNEVLKEMEEDIETKIKKLCAPPKTNFDKITESVESLVDAFEQNMGRFDSRKEFIEWLQQEANG